MQSNDKTNYYTFYSQSKAETETFSACLTVLNDLCEVLGFFVITDFMSAMIDFSIAFSCWVIIFDCFTKFVLFLFK